MKRLTRILSILAFGLLAGTAQANTNVPPVGVDDESLMTDFFAIDAGDRVEIKAYDKKTDSYQIHVVDTPTIEAIYATPESVARAIGSVNPESMKADPMDIVGTEFVLDDDLVILFDFERDARTAKNP